jgi:hypothetical protein
LKFDDIQRRQKLEFWLLNWVELLAAMAERQRKYLRGFVGVWGFWGEFKEV